MKKAIKFAILLAVLFGWEIVVPINQTEAAQPPWLKMMPKFVPFRMSPGP
jgi:hypothetical protein